MAHSQYDFDKKVKKFQGKTPHECYKLIWQWIKEKSISLSLFEVLCDYITNNADRMDRL